MIVEIVAQSADDAVLAEQGGASRIELVSALSLGGLTPSLGTLEQTRERCALPIMAMLRPRSGGFDYTSGEFASMLRDGRRFLDCGAQGLVFGVLDGSGRIDMVRNQALVALGGEAVFHRAFDRLEDPFESLDTLIRLGFRRVLTSGGSGTALEGAETIRKLVERANGRIEILPGGGVRPANAAQIVALTGVDQIHLAGLEWVPDSSMEGSELVFNGSPHPENQFSRVSVGTVREVVRTVSSRPE